MLCKAMRDDYDLIAITNDIYTKEDQRLLTVSGACPRAHPGRGNRRLPHTAIREDCSINLEAIDRMLGEFPTPTSCLWKAAATTWPPPSAPS